MAQFGFETYDASGNVVLSTAMFAGIVLGVLDVSSGGGGTSGDGSVTNVGFLDGTPFYIAVCRGGLGAYEPTLSYNASTQTLSWTFPTRTPRPLATFRIIWGTY